MVSPDVPSVKWISLIKTNMTYLPFSLGSIFGMATNLLPGGTLVIMESIKYFAKQPSDKAHEVLSSVPSLPPVTSEKTSWALCTLPCYVQCKQLCALRSRSIVRGAGAVLLKKTGLKRTKLTRSSIKRKNLPMKMSLPAQRVNRVDLRQSKKANG